MTCLQCHSTENSKGCHNSILITKPFKQHDVFNKRVTRLFVEPDAFNEWVTNSFKRVDVSNKQVTKPFKQVDVSSNQVTMPFKRLTNGLLTESHYKNGKPLGTFTHESSQMLLKEHN